MTPFDEKIERVINKVEAEVVDVKTGLDVVAQVVEKKSIGSNRAILIQTIMLVVSLVGIALAAERRVSVMETENKATSEALKVEIIARQAADERLANVMDRLQKNSETLTINQTRVVTILEVIEQRHAIEDGYLNPRAKRPR